MRFLPRKGNVALGVGLGAMLVFVVGSFALLWRYKGTPGQPSDAPARWPATTGIVRPPGQPMLVMFAHPRCPCTRASLGELRKVVSGLRSPATVEVWFGVPDDEPGDEPELTAAATIPGVAVRIDRGGREAARFGAHVSGTVVLYDRDGRLRFQGGITAARGHAGDSEGGAMLEAQLAEVVPATLDAPVFGCALVTEDIRP